MSKGPEGEYLQYGGQAVIEGVMMRSPRYFAVACRAPNGEIVLETEALEKTWIGRQKWLKLPFLRGSLALIDAMALGGKAMRFASKIQLDPQYEKKDETAAEHTVVQASTTVQNITIAATLVFSLIFGFFIFNFLPNLISQQLQSAGASWVLINFVTEMIKMIFFFAYIGLIGLMPEIREVFKYHGAEHKAINTLEAKQELTIENCRAQTRLHPRCGTSFAIFVLIVSFLTFTFIPRYLFVSEQSPKILITLSRVGIELLILPFVSGIAYELIRFAGKFRNEAFVQFLFWPGLKTQYLTTKEPDEHQIEVALVSLKAVVDAETSGLPEPHETREEGEEASTIA